MTYLEMLIGKPLSDCSREELEQKIMQGRVAREMEAAGAQTKRRGGGTGTGGGKKKKQEIPDFDLLDDDDDLPELDLED